MINNISIGIVGFGGVGKAFLKLINEKANDLKNDSIDISVKFIANSAGSVMDNSGLNVEEIIELIDKDLKLSCYNNFSNNNAIDFLLDNVHIDIAVVVTPTNKDTGEPGLSIVWKLLERKISVVLADKGPVIKDYLKLKELALANGVSLGIGCTAGGALPSINAGIIDMAGAKISLIEGVLNGTTNYIINEMENSQCTYEEALKKAQNNGIAEVNPSLDVEGFDTASKLLIITNAVMNLFKTLDNVTVEGITTLTPNDIHRAKLEGKRFKLIGKTEMIDNEVKMQVSLEKVGIDNLFYNVTGENKAVRYIGDSLGELVVMGGASGLKATAGSLLRDIVNIIKLQGGGK